MPRKVKGYSRVDSGDAHGWLVRIKRGELRRSSFVSDSTHGGKNKARKVAQQIFEKWTKELPEPDTAEGKIGKRNSSGFVGVHYTHDVDSRYPNCSYEYYIASWKTDAGARRNVRFAISKYGKRKAFELACLSREKKESDRGKVETLHARGVRAEKPVSASKRSAGRIAKTSGSRIAKPVRAKSGSKKAVKARSASKVAQKGVKKKSSKKRTTGGKAASRKTLSDRKAKTKRATTKAPSKRKPRSK